MILPLSAGLTLTGLVMGGCEVDSYLDPSSIGRFEHTPTTMPILHRIAAIEPDDSEYVQVTQVQPEDLRPLVTDYRLVPGDTLDVIIFNYPTTNTNTPFQVRVENDGTIELPGIGKFFVLRGTSDEVRRIVSDGLIAQDLIRRPELSVNITGRSEQQFSVIGSVRAPGPYFIPEPSYRLLDAIAAAGGLIDESTQEIFVIRQVALSDEYGNVGAPGTSQTIDPTTGNPTNEAPQDDSSKLLDLIDELSDPANGNDDPSPSIIRPTNWTPRQPEDTASDQTKDPAVDLVQPAGDVDNPLSPFDTASSQWIFIDGRWVQIKDTTTDSAGRSLRERADAELAAEDLVTQRIISIPVDRLLQGDARQNIVIRPGDILRVPSQRGGTVYLGGQIVRPGAFDVNPKLTLLRLIDAAGGLGGLAIPERVDLMRMVGPDRQATIRLNLRAIADQTQPDIFIKPNDRITIGTNFWAFPLAVVRGGFRTSYGFGFLLDRNFGNDVFGAPPRNTNF